MNVSQNGDIILIMETTRITDKCALLDKLDEIGKEAFPPSEYVAPSSFLGDDDVGIYALTEGGEAVGYMCAGMYAELTYLFFLAVAPAFRNAGRGAAAIKTLGKLRPGVPVVVDPELAGEGMRDNDLRLRRRGFYLRNGFYPTGSGMTYNGEYFELLCTDRHFDIDIFVRSVEKYRARGFAPRYFEVKA